MKQSNPYIFEGLTEQQLRLIRSSGFPTFDEYIKNPDKYRKSNEDIFAVIERGPETLRNATKGKHVLKVLGKRVSSIGQMIRVAKDMGFDLKKMTFEVNLENVGNGQYIHHVNLVPQKELRVGDES